MIINRLNKISLLFLMAIVHFTCSSNNKYDDREKMDTDNIMEYYSSQSRYTDPGSYRYLYEGIPSDISRIVNTVQGVLLHLNQVEMDRIQIPKKRHDREVRLNTVEAMLNCISKMDDRPITFSRPTEKRMIGICTHFALLTCSILRYKGIPARSRGGFETYYSSEVHHDHWICEYWNASEKRWVKIDPELNNFLKKEWDIKYNNLDLPQNIFLTGAETWKLCRSGGGNPDHFGIHGDRWYGGWEFVLTEMVLDFIAFNKTELLPWDGNSLSEKDTHQITDEEFTLLDQASELAVATDASFHEMRMFYKNNRKLQK